MNRKRKIKIAPSLMCCNFLNLGEEVKRLEEAGADLFHIDIMDGNFVDNFAMSPIEIKVIRKITDTPLDVHLMINEPIRYIKEFYEAGVDTITVHGETCRHLNSTLQEIKKYGLKAGLALNPGTSHLTIEPVIDYIDIVLVMAVNPGFVGQKFIPSTVKKVENTRKLLDDLGFSHIDIQVDGNINTSTIPPLYEKGADIFVAGTAGLFFGNMEYENNIKALKRCMKNNGQALELA